MGLYVNPRDMEKEEWLEKNCTLKSRQAIGWEFLTDDHLIVCLIYNGLFTAAGVAYDSEEYKRFADNDGRPKEWFMVNKELLKKVCPDYGNYVNTIH